ncbi:cytochrome P450 71D8-like [Abrus precatorius]|uniref:Cytochrome P450 71D8-like n=1 Tax=Abrus precatorius TaxID=3816 RepID=A0A8B8M2K5_ABRPR|nr:cytochrome P450 71D8-like [Abrus precatorius]
METQAYFVVIVFSLFLLLYWLAKYYKPKTTLKNKLPPGPRKLPIIGNLHQLALTGSLPHRALRELAHKYGPLMHLQLGEISTVVVSSPWVAKEITKTHDLAFVQRPHIESAQLLSYGGRGIAFAPYGDYWRQVRKICVSELLSVKRVQSISFIREDETAKFIDSIRACAGSSINLTNKIFSLVGSSVSRSAFGLKSKDHDEFIYLIKKIIEAAAGFELADVFPSMKFFINFFTGRKARLEKLQDQIDKVLENIIKQHKENKIRAKGNKVDVDNEDLVDVLLRIQQSDTLDVKITARSIKALILDVFAAGTDTSASTLEWAMAEMMRNPRVREKAQAEIREAFGEKEIIHEADLEQLTYLKLVIKETLRVHPPTPLLLPRECSELTIIDGYEIPAKTKIMVNVWAIARDPQYWTDPERFFPERFDGSSIDFKGNNFEYLPFGAGRRMCPGMTFGLATIMLPLALLLYHFNWELPNEMKPESLDMTEHFGLAIGKEKELCLIPYVYDPTVHH